MATETPYEVLGVKPTATADEIRTAYRKLAKELHPDLNPGKPAAEARFKAVSAAYDILSDPRARKAGSTSRRARWTLATSTICSRRLGAVAVARAPAVVGVAAKAFRCPAPTATIR
jgi:hypothetical protein